MGSLLSEKYKESVNRITQVTGMPNSRTIAALDHLLICVPSKPPAAVWRQVPQGAKVRALMKRRTEGSVPAITTRAANERQTGIAIGTLDADASAFEQLCFARKLIESALSGKAGAMGLWVLGFEEREAEVIAQRLAAAALAIAFPLADFKSKPQPPRIRSIRLLGFDRKLDLRRVIAEARGNNLARWLTALPANKLHAAAYIDLLKELAGEHGWEFRKYGVSELERLGAGAFLAVAQGNADDNAAIVRLRYRANGKSAAPDLSLVGKGIIFDTGGTNLKPFPAMMDMHIDMGGSAVAVGTLLAISELALPKSVDCWVAITENRTGPTAYKPQDVVTALNGKTVQVIHTDAEGRMALADTLTLASRGKPGLVVDYATLTGACITALTRRYSGVFTNRPDLHPVLKHAGRDSGERVWPFPADKEFLAELKSDTADISQCTPDAGGDHILAAAFLSEFVEDGVPWIHVDLSAAKRKGGLGHIPTEITGFGVRFTLHLLLDSEMPQVPDLHY
ncbi:MAG TPA: leucyl aminopeptidase family protein [Woeseiaceae bacterium]|nr:leucyl aminopeptidase family protein [Woeseiaceae bacterium]